jgi:hypothetical protein
MWFFHLLHIRSCACSSAHAQSGGGGRKNARICCISSGYSGGLYEGLSYDYINGGIFNNWGGLYDGLSTDTAYGDAFKVPERTHDNNCVACIRGFQSNDDFSHFTLCVYMYVLCVSWLCINNSVRNAGNIAKNDGGEEVFVSAVKKTTLPKKWR